MEKALEVASCGVKLREAVDALAKKYWAQSTMAVKRQEVLKLAGLVMGSRPVFPLSKSGVEGVAAALKAANLASGDQYLNELKMMHVESGFLLEPWLLRVLACFGALQKGAD